jgi:hypothetical protein
MAYLSEIDALAQEAAAVFSPTTTDIITVAALLALLLLMPSIAGARSDTFGWPSSRTPPPAQNCRNEIVDLSWPFNAPTARAPAGGVKAFCDSTESSRIAKMRRNKELAQKSVYA